MVIVYEFYCCVIVCCYSECISHTRQAEKSAWPRFFSLPGVGYTLRVTTHYIGYSLVVNLIGSRDNVDRQWAIHKPLIPLVIGEISAPLLTYGKDNNLNKKREVGIKIWAFLRACSYDPACRDVSPSGTDISMRSSGGFIPLAEMKYCIINSCETC